MRDVAVVGAGIVGCAIGLELARRGASCTVIDRNGEVGHGSTSASCGIVRRFYSTPTMIAMAHEGAHTWADWAGYLGVPEDSGIAHFERPGMLFIPPAIDDRVRAVVGHMRDLGVEVELLSKEEVEERFPFLDASSHSPIRQPDDDSFFDDTGRPIAGAVLEPDAGYVVSPQLATTDLRRAGDEAGVRFRLGRAVTEISRSGDGFRISLQDGSVVRAGVVVNAAGPHSAIVNELAGVSLPIETRALRREVHAMDNPLFSAAAGSPVPILGDVDSGIYLRPEARGREFMVGSLDPECDEKEWVTDPDDFDETCSRQAFERHALRLMKRFPEVTLGSCRGVAGLYDVTLRDWNPILDRTDEPGFYVAMGTSGSSFKTAPVIGMALAELIQAGEAGRDHDRDPVGLTLPRTGAEIDLGFFSRNRGAHASSGSVLG
ncbi:MAG: FAD-dependent oxidoreductase [Planctomycetes bacterium]|nr:FAD-dependent oxidoreductase [Planctomycetota bacterium]